jgi:hypothetical protein
MGSKDVDVFPYHPQSVTKSAAGKKWWVCGAVGREREKGEVRA